MSYRDSVVRIRGFLQVGSGSFIGDGLVLTAGHVMESGGRDPTTAEFNIVHPITRKTWRVTEIRVHPQWRIGSDPGADVALLQVIGPPVPVIQMAPFAGGTMTRFGIPANPTDSLGKGQFSVIGALSIDVPIVTLGHRETRHPKRGMVARIYVPLS